MVSIRLSLGVFLLTYFSDVIKCQDFEVPPALVEPLYPVGLRVSIPDSEGIKLFAFHGNVNVDFENGLEAGQMATDVLRKKNNRWTYINRTLKLKIGDTIYYWLHVIRGDLGYNRVFQSHLVTEFFDESGKSVGTGGSVPQNSPITPGPPINPPPPAVITQPNTPQPSCQRSVTKVNGQENKCKGALILHTQFNKDLKEIDEWNNVVEFGENELEFTILDNDRSNSYTESGSLVIKPVFLDKLRGSQFAISGSSIDLRSKCTSSVERYCYKEPQLGVITPVVSARLSTKETFSFRYGTVEVKAKLPRGDWVVPEIWLVNKFLRYGLVNSGKIVIGKSLGNKDLTIDGFTRGNNHFYCGLEVGKKIFKYDQTKQSGLFSEVFHLFKVTWEPDQIRFYMDNEQIGRWSTSDGNPLINEAPEKIAPFNDECYLVLGVHVGGIGETDFPDRLKNNGKEKPWGNTKAKRMYAFYNDSINWLPTWSNDHTALRVEHVKVWAL